MGTDTADLKRRALRRLVIFLAVMAGLLLVPAGSLRYWQGLVYWLICAGAFAAITVYLLKHDPALIERRLASGPAAEKEKAQKIIQGVISLCFFLLFVVSAVDHRLQWSAVPVPLVLLADVGVAFGLAVIFRVFRENSFASATIEIAAGQRVIASGPYAIVRHPMYVGVLVLLAATPLALGSCWALLILPPGCLAVIWRLIEEERFLRRNLPGYDDYCRRTRYRLIPWVW
jgi:protein-S-isoprenylcysteine O-methyltransferase Ste14